MHIILCHGWGLDAQSMQALSQALVISYPDVTISSVELGMTGLPLHRPTLLDSSEETAIAIGHSYGFSWLMQQPKKWHAAIAINGFTHFCRQAGYHTGTPKRVVDIMLEKLRHAGDEVLDDFYRRCGLTIKAPKNLDISRLEYHLRQLKDLQMTLPACPLLALAGTQDKVVPADLSTSCFFPRVQWLVGEHALPQQQTLACIQAMQPFLDLHIHHA